MYTKINRKTVRHAIKRRIRRKISGDARRPRLAVFRSSSHFYVQAVDDATATTVCAASTMDKELASFRTRGGGIPAARAVGGLIATRLKEKGIDTVVFDRGGYLYHGRVQAAAEAAREKGLKF